MAQLTFLGTCSGTEPMPNRHHSSILLRAGGSYYWFDAGENCSHKAYTSGVDVSLVRAVFISHMHIDHIGGLANLMFTIHKVARVTGSPHVNDNCYDIFVPDIKKLECVRSISGISHNNSIVKATEHEICGDGVIFEDENVRVSAVHNTHLKENGENGWHSYSFLVECEGKRIVLSGDVRTPAELDAYTEYGCDVLVMETGHHKVADVCAYAKDRGVKRLLFTHHGREILNDVEGARSFIKCCGVEAVILDDGDVICV